MTSRYHVQAYPHRNNLAKSPDCPYFPGVREALALFACTCPKFREAHHDTAAHNQVRKIVSLLLAKRLLDRWKLHDETPWTNPDCS